MALIKKVRGFEPHFGNQCWFADTATLIGEVKMGDQCTVWFNAVVRGDVNHITMGNKVNVQDGVVIHGTYEKAGTTIGNNVSIGHNALVHGCTIKDNVLVGMGAIIMDNAVVQENVIIAAGAVILANTVCEPNSIYAGVPAKKVKELTPEHAKGEIERIANAYPMYASWFQEE